MSGFGENTEEDISTLMHSINDYLQLDRKLTMVKTYAEEHPVLSLFWLVTLVICCIPVICFCTFVCASVFLTIAGFVLIEGTLVTIATVLLGGALFLAALLAVGFSSSVVLAFYMIHYSLDMVQRLSNKIDRARTIPSRLQEKPEVVGENVLK